MRKPKVNTTTAYRSIRFQALQFYDASRILQAHHPSKPGEALIVMPLIVTLSFTLELLLKALLIRFKRKYSEIHDLAALYAELPDQIQLELRESCKMSQKQFDKLLTINALGFETFRYFHDKKQAQFAKKFAFELADAIRYFLADDDAEGIAVTSVGE